MAAAMSDWAFPIVIVPKPGTGKPGEKKEWRLCIDLRKLNLLVPHDTFEPPTCDACLEWLAQRPCRSMADLRWGFHQVLLSERLQKIMTLVTPFGTFSYKRLVMGVNVSASFCRGSNCLKRSAPSALVCVPPSVLSRQTTRSMSYSHQVARRNSCAMQL